MRGKTDLNDQTLISKMIKFDDWLNANAPSAGFPADQITR